MTQVASLSRSGLADFLVQRVSAVLLLLYAACVLGWFLVSEEISHAALTAWFGSAPMRLFSILAVLATAAHGWVGMWTVGTDYLRPHYFGRWATACRLLYQVGVLLILFIYVAWGVTLFWFL